MKRTTLGARRSRHRRPPLACRRRRRPRTSRPCSSRSTISDFGKQDYSAVYDIVSEKPGENPSTTQVKIFRRDDHDQIVILLQKPEKQKGQGYLKIDDNVWFYDPESGNYSHSTMKENINGSQAKNSDFKKYTFADDFDIVKTEEGRLGVFDTWILTLQAKNDEVSYQKIRLTVRKDKPLPLKEEDFSVSDRPCGRSIPSRRYIQVGGQARARQAKDRRRDKQGHAERDSRSRTSTSASWTTSTSRRPSWKARDRSPTHECDSHFPRISGLLLSAHALALNRRLPASLPRRPPSRRPSKAADRPRARLFLVRRGHVRQPETVTQTDNVSKEAQGQSNFLKYDQVKVGGSVHEQGRPHFGLGIALGRQRTLTCLRRATTSRPISRET